MPHRSVTLFALLALAPFAPALDPAPTAAVERVKKDLAYLAGDECQGRGLDTKGILKAGEYVAAQFKAAGLKPAFEGGYFQPFEVPAPNKLGTPQVLTLKSGDTTLEPKAGDGFVATVASGGGKKGGVVFAGYGITSETPKYDDYAGLDVKGKLVIVLRRSPKADDPHGPFAAHAPLAAKVENAAKHGAAGLLVVSDRGTAAETDPLMDPDLPGDVRMDGPVLHVKRAVVDTLLKGRKTTLGELEVGITKDGKPNSFELAGWEADATVTVIKRTWPARNVVGVCDGAGPLADETVVVGAHYDHLGAGERGSFPTNRGQTHYGADDNASGTTALLELARRFGGMKNRQGRRIVFVAFSGEEQGLFGSKHYCKQPPFPLDKTAFMLNMDMVGRMAQVDDAGPDGKPVKKDRLVVYGTGTSTGLADRVQAANKGFDFKLFTIPGGTGPSDHTSFYDKGIPVLFLFTGTHKDYHRPSDTPDKINVPGLLKVADYAQVFADHYAAVKDKPDFLKTKGGGEDPTDPNPRGRVSVPKIKFTPGNYGEEGKGVLVEAVEEGGPAAKGGIKEGDYIVEIGGQAVNDPNHYMRVMGGVKPDAPVEFVVLRGGQKVKLTVTPIK